MKFLLLMLNCITSMLGLGVVTSAAVSGGGYVAIPEAVRDFYSREVLFFAQPRLKFLQFAKVKEDLTAVRGKSIVFTKYGNLDGGGELDENQAVNTEGLTTSEIVIPVKEHGNSVEVTEYLLNTSLLDVLGDTSRLLASNMAKILDIQFRDAVLLTTNVVFGNQKADATALADGDGLTTGTVKDAVETLAANNAPRVQGEYYVCMAHPHQLRQLRDDSAWINANTYLGRRQLYLGEVGMYEGVVFIETTQMPKMDTATTEAKYAGFAATNGYEAVIFGENAYAWAVALPVEMRDDGVKELGRKHRIGWYGIWGSGIIEESNIVKILTA
jgi:N4-gp56 family major capsid protein